MTRSTVGRVAVLVVLVSVVFFMIVTPAHAVSHNPVVAGTVYGSDGQAIPGANIAVSHQVRGVWRQITSIAADSSGAWSFSGKPDDYRFQVSAPSADTQTRELAMVKDGAYTLDVTLPAYGAIAGTISDSQSGVGIEAAAVDFYRNDGSGWVSVAGTTTDTDGSFRSPTLPCGTYLVRASKTGYSPAFLGGGNIDEATRLAVLRGQTASGGFALSPSATTGSISGIVVNGASRTPMAGAYVWLYKQNPDGTWPPTSPYSGQPTHEFTTGLDGRYSSGPIPLGNYKVRFFTVHTGSQYWQYAATPENATVLSLTYGGQEYTGIEGWMNKP